MDAGEAAVLKASSCPIYAHGPGSKVICKFFYLRVSLIFFNILLLQYLWRLVKKYLYRILIVNFFIFRTLHWWEAKGGVTAAKINLSMSTCWALISYVFWTMFMAPQIWSSCSMPYKALLFCRCKNGKIKATPTFYFIQPMPCFAGQVCRYALWWLEVIYSCQPRRITVELWQQHLIQIWSQVSHTT